MESIQDKYLSQKKQRKAKNLLLKAALMWITLLWGAGEVKGQVIVGNASSGQNNTGNTVTVSHTTGTNNNRLMLVGVSTRDRLITVPSAGEETINVTYAGENLVFVGTSVGSTGANNDAVTYIFMLVDPPSGTSNVVVTFSTNLADNNRGKVGVTTFSGVDQNAPIGTFQVSNGDNISPSLTQSSTNTSQLIFNVLAITNTSTITANSGQTQRWLESVVRPIGAGYTLAGTATSTTSSYTSANLRWSVSGVAINPVPIANLGITKTVNIDKPFAGQTITFTLTANNTGPSNAPNVEVFDQLPSGFTYVSHSTATGNYNAGAGVWSIGTLNNGASATLTITAVVNGTGNYTNVATISGDVIDNTSGNNTAQVACVLCGAGGNPPLFKSN